MALSRSSARVTNAGARDGEEVVQLYLTRPGLAGAPIRALAGFQRIALKAGETREVRFTLSGRTLSSVDPQGARKVFAGPVEAWIGGGQPVARDGMAMAPGGTAKFEIRGEMAVARWRAESDVASVAVINVRHPELDRGPAGPPWHRPSSLFEWDLRSAATAEEKRDPDQVRDYTASDKEVRCSPAKAGASLDAKRRMHPVACVFIFEMDPGLRRELQLVRTGHAPIKSGVMRVNTRNPKPITATNCETANPYPANYPAVQLEREFA